MPEGYTHLTREQRNHIQMYRARWTQQAIAESLGVSQPTISRELGRNRDRRQAYEAATAHQLATQRRIEASRSPRKVPPNFLDDCVIPGLDDGRNPKVISHDLKRTGGPSVSAKWIYELIDREHRHGDPDIAHYLRRKYKKKSPFKRSKGAGVHIIPHRVDMSERPAEVDTRATFGHWEADTIVGARHQGAIVTLVERKTRQGFCFHVPRRTKTRVADAIIAMLASRAGAVKTITFDNGGEFADHERIAAALDCKTYFARPYRSCDRGTNEHFNGMLRYYYPKRMSLRSIDHADLAMNVAHLNSVPREILGFEAPREQFEREMRALNSPPPS